MLLRSMSEVFNRPLAYSYVRFSSPEQSKGDSLRRQIAAAEAYAEENGLRLDSSMRDLGISAFGGANRARGSLGTFLAAVESGAIPSGSTLIVESLDRLSREDVLSAQEGLLGLIRAGITVVTLIDRQSYSRESIANDWTKLMMSLVHMARAHEESATKSVRVAKAWGQKRIRSTETREALTRKCVAWCAVEGTGRDARMVLIPERAEVIRRIFELTAEGFGQRTVAGALNREGAPVWGHGDGWQPSYICKILGSRSVLGFYQPHRKPRADVHRTPEGLEIAGYYPAAVTEELYYRAIAARGARRGKGGPKGNGVANLFSNLAKCAACGRTMTFLNKGPQPKGGRFVTCDSYLRGMPCDAPATWPYERAEKAILHGIRRLDVAGVLGRGSSAAEDARSRVTALAAQLAAEEGKRDRLIIALGDVMDSAVVARVRSAVESVERLKSEHGEAEKAAGVAAHGGGELPDRLALVAELGERTANLEGEELYKLRMLLSQELKRVLVRLRFTPKNILADYKVDEGRTASAFQWLTGVPLLQDDETKGTHAENARMDDAMEGMRQMGSRRKPRQAVPL